MQNHNYIKLIINSIKKFELNLKNLTVLTEAATGNFKVTAVIAALAGAKVIAFTKNSKYGTIKEVKTQTIELAKECEVIDSIKIIESLEQVDLSKVNIVTNSGMLRPINKVFLDRLRSDTVIPLMYEPWELRKADIDIAECRKRNIWVCGTNESDSRLQTMKYIGYIVLFFLLKNKKTPFSCNILLLGDNKFGGAISEVLINNNFNYKWIKDYKKILKIENYNVIVTADHTNPDLLIGKNGLIRSNKIAKNVLIIHISGNVDFTEIKCQTIPEKPAHFGHMSFTTDFIDPKAVIDLHVAGLKVAEGMNKAKFMNLSANDLKCFLETDYPGLIDNLPLCPNIN